MTTPSRFSSRLSKRSLRLARICAAALLAAAASALAADPPPAPGQTVSLFDGKSFGGWEGNSKIWRVEDGALTGGSLSEMVVRNEFLATRRDYTNFIVRFKIKLTGSEGFINSGFQIRSQRSPNSSEMRGYQCDFGDPTWWGAIYDEDRRNRVMSPSDMAALGPVIRRNEWNDYVIRAEGPRVTTWINGAQGTDYYESDAAIPDFGKLGIQVHGGGKALVQVKDITVEELPPTPENKKFRGAPEPPKASKPSPLAPEEQRQAFTLPPGFEMELVAAEEPGVGKFITVDWDQQGRMWSMTAFDYPVDANESPEEAKALYSNPGKDRVLVFDQPFGPGPHRSRVFADGLAIPLGILPYKNGVYAQHGPDIVFLNDTNNDGKADQREVILTGFGVQDSHLFPHQFTRAPGNWLWMAQGAFNYGKVKAADGEIQFDATRMARFRADGTSFDITSQGPCNIWGLVMGAEGDVWIQEANDYGYPVMPFHEYANYPGCSDRYFKSYGPEFPGTAEFRLGGTGLSGLALSDKSGAWPEPYADVMYVANPITRRINSIKIHRDGPRYKFQQLPDLVASSDEMFRPVSIQYGPDGCLYIVDWYNKIISHNEVPRAHPERDKTRGRIWRVKHKSQKPFEAPDFTRLGADALLAKLGGESVRQSHLAWQAITDRQLTELAPKLKAQMASAAKTPAQRIAALWALEGLTQVDAASLAPMLADSSRNVRREAVRAFGEAGLPGLIAAITPLADDPDPEVRAQVIRSAGWRVSRPWSVSRSPMASDASAIALLVRTVREPLAQPMAPATRDGRPMKVREAYEREFERYLIRLFLEAQPQAVAQWLDSDAAKNLPPENLMLAALALEPKTSAPRVAAYLPKLSRAPGNEEILRLAEFLDEADVSGALRQLLQTPASRASTLQALLAVRTRLPAERLKPMLTESARPLFTGAAAEKDLAIRAVSGFQLDGLEPEMIALLRSETSAPRQAAALRALRESGSSQAELFSSLAKSAPDAAVRAEAIAALAAQKDGAGAQTLISLWPDLAQAQRRDALGKLSGSKAGAAHVIKAARAGVIAKAELDGATFEKLQAVAGGEPEFATFAEEVSQLYRPALILNGGEQAYADPGLTLDGAFTIEAWVRLEPGIGNSDGIFGAPDALDLNFFDSTFRVWAGRKVHDAVAAKKRVAPEFWTHVAATRNAAGFYKIYINGTFDNAAAVPAPGKVERGRIGWTGTGKGMAGALAEFRIWNRERSAEEIGAFFDRSLEGQAKPKGLIFYATGAGPWGKLGSGARVAKISDFPPLLTAAESAAADARFARMRTLAEHPGSAERGKTLSAACAACHLIQGQGGRIGPDLSGAGVMGTEALLRNLLTPNAAMEAGYRTYRVELKNGDIEDGFYVSENNDAIVLRQPGAEDRRIAKNDIRNSGFIRRSLMPEGLLDAMQPQEVSDLFAYLRTLK